MPCSLPQDGYFSNPSRWTEPAVTSKILFVIRFLERNVSRFAPFLAVPLLFASMSAIFFWVPTDAGLGISQRIFYWHVPCATTCFGAFAFAGISSGMFLYSRDRSWDHAAQAAVSVGMLFGTLVLVTGSIWARTAWGTWWTWDARLTTFLVLWLLFASYLVLRSLSDDELGPRYAAVLALVGTLNIPLVMFATRLWRTIHPQVIRNPNGGIDDPRMVAALVLSFAAFFTFAPLLWSLRVRVLRLTEEVAVLEHELANPRNTGLAGRTAP
ncbi:MAG: heme exporter protein C [Hyphomicrobiaceae bacterium]|jgi:heme exporter protein C